jgi:hypothetical protein
MLLAVSVVSAHIEETHRRWKLEAHLKEGQTQLAVQQRVPSVSGWIQDALHTPCLRFREAVP